MTTPTSSAPTVDTQLIASDFAKAMAGRLTPAQIDEARALITSTKATYAMSGAVTTFGFGFGVTVGVIRHPPGPYQFVGGGGGLFFPPGVSPVIGALSTSDYTRLQTHTSSIFMACAASYINITWFDSRSSVLGTFNGAEVAGLGTGGGTGNWFSPLPADSGE